MSERSSDSSSETVDSSPDSSESSIKFRLKKKLKQLRRCLNKNNANNEWLIESIRNLNPVQSENVPLPIRDSRYQGPTELGDESAPKKSYSTSTNKEAFDKQQKLKYVGPATRKTQVEKIQHGGDQTAASGAVGVQRKCPSQPTQTIAKPQAKLPTKPPAKPLSAGAESHSQQQTPAAQQQQPAASAPAPQSGKQDVTPPPLGTKPKQPQQIPGDMYVSPRLKNIRLQEHCSKLEQTVKEKDAKIDELTKQVSKLERVMESWQDKMNATRKVRFFSTCMLCFH